MRFLFEKPLLKQKSTIFFSDIPHLSEKGDFPCRQGRAWQGKASESKAIPDQVGTGRTRQSKAKHGQAR